MGVCPGSLKVPSVVEIPSKVKGFECCHCGRLLLEPLAYYLHTLYTSLNNFYLAQENDQEITKNIALLLEEDCAKLIAFFKKENFSKHEQKQ